MVIVDENKVRWIMEDRGVHRRKAEAIAEREAVDNLLLEAEYGEGSPENRIASLASVVRWLMENR